MRLSPAAIFKDRARFKRKSATNEERFSRIHPSQRVLLLSHGLRSSKGCKAKIEPWGVDCVGCNPSCQVNRLKKTALDSGYKAVCVAPGGSLALKFVKENNPLGIVAVACRKELEEGMENVQKLIKKKSGPAPAIVIIPLTKDGCVDTEVNIEAAVSKISLGCESGINDCNERLCKNPALK